MATHRYDKMKMAFDFVIELFLADELTRIFAPTFTKF